MVFRYLESLAGPVPTDHRTQADENDGCRAVFHTADTALRLARYFGTSADYWMNLQKAYELRLAEQTVGREIKATVKPRAA